MTKQEQRHQLIIAMIQRDWEVGNMVKIANDLMAEMYGKDWESQPEVEHIPGCGRQHAEIFHPLITKEVEECINYKHVPIVSIAEKNGEKGVRLCFGDVDIFVEAHDLDNGEEYEWEEAMSRLKEVDKTTFNKHQMYIIAAYKNEINEKFREIGGDELKGLYWSSTEYDSAIAWFVAFSDGYLNGYGKYYTFTVRPVAAF